MENKNRETYTDKQLKDATQVAYLNFLERAIKNRMADPEKGKGPFVIKDLLMDCVDGEKLEKDLSKAKQELKQAEEGLSKAKQELKQAEEEFSKSENKSIIALKKIKIANQKVFYENEKIKKMPFAELATYTDLIPFDQDIIANLSEEALNWKIIDIHDRNKENGFYGCVIETDDNNAIVGFRGSEGIKDYEGLVNDWIKNDFGLFKNKCTEQQKETERFLDSLAKDGTLDKYSSIYVTGHSLGGNLSSHFVVASAIGEHRKKIFDKIAKCVSFDGPGVSKEYLEYYKEGIEKAGEKIKHFRWSLVGCLLNDIPGQQNEDLTTNEKILEDMKLASFEKHTTKSIMFSKTGKAIRGPLGTFEKFMHSISVKAEYVPTEALLDMFVPNSIQKYIGMAATALKSIVKKAYNRDEYVVDDGTMAGTIFNYLKNEAEKAEEFSKKSGHEDVEQAARNNPSVNTDLIRRTYEENVDKILDNDFKQR